MFLNNYLNQYEKCSQNPLEKKISNKINFLNEKNCLNDEFFNNYTKTNLYIYFNNKSNNYYLFNKLINKIKINLELNNCFLLNKTNLIILNELKEINSILFNHNSLNIIIDIDKLKSNIFYYNIILEMPKNKKYKKKLNKKIDYSFLEEYKHPAEQIVILNIIFVLINIIK